MMKICPETKIKPWGNDIEMPVPSLHKVHMYEADISSCLNRAFSNKGPLSCFALSVSRWRWINFRFQFSMPWRVRGRSCVERYFVDYGVLGG